MDSPAPQTHQVEVMAPAGNWAALHAALQAHADAVYLCLLYTSDAADDIALV